MLYARAFKNQNLGKDKLRKRANIYHEKNAIKKAIKERNIKW